MLASASETSRGRAAFTLIEAMIAVALGAVICLAAAAAFRVCGQTMAAAQRLSVENRVMCGAVDAALDELDSWRLVDDPEDAGKQPLRRPRQPFAPLSLSSVGLDLPDDPSQPRSWFRGLGYNNEETRLGDYSLFSGAGWTAPGADAATIADRRWYAALIGGVSSQLGYYAMVDYAPAGAIFDFYDDTLDTTPRIPAEFLTTLNRTTNPSPVISGPESTCLKPLGVRELIHNNGYVITLDATYLARDAHHRRFAGGPTGLPAPWSQVSMYSDAAPIVGRPLPLEPSAWPSLTVRFKRYIMQSPVFTQRAEITLQNPVTGAVTAFGLTPTATTLRGARRQRGLDR